MTKPNRTLAVRVYETAEQINNVYGYGNVSRCRVYLDGRVELVIRRPYMRDKKRIGRYTDGRLHFAGTSRKIPE